jgi:hypothetical protein
VFFRIALEHFLCQFFDLHLFVFKLIPDLALVLFGMKMNKKFVSARHAGLDPASSSKIGNKRPGFPFDVAQGGERVEPRVKPGMTKQE